MVNTVYLHIGMNKTGSSAIQHYFAYNRELLAAKGLLYPKAGCKGNAHYALSTLLGFSHSKPEVVDLQSTAIKSFKRTLNEEIQRYQPKSLIFSSETFVLLRPVECVKELFDDYNVKVVVYLRRHDKWWPSSYNQSVRMVANPPWGRTFRAYLNFFEKKRPWVGDYRLLVDRWAEVFGQKNIIVRPYESQQNEPGLVHDFMRAVGMESLVQEIEPEFERINNSIGMETLALVDACQRARIDPEVRAKLISSVLSAPHGSVVSGALDPHLLMGLAEKHKDDYAYIAKEYLGREDGRLFYDALPDLSGEWKRNNAPSLDIVVESLVSAMKMTPADAINASA